MTDIETFRQQLDETERLATLALEADFPAGEVTGLEKGRPRSHVGLRPRRGERMSDVLDLIDGALADHGAEETP
jgi:hypothetical protein